MCDTLCRIRASLSLRSGVIAASRSSSSSNSTMNGQKDSGTGISHSPEPGDDPEIRLREDPVEVGADPVRVQMGRLGARVVAESRVQHLACSEDDLHSRNHLEAIAVGTVSEATFHDVADEAGIRPRARAVDPERHSVFGKVPGELLLGDAGLDDGVAQLGVDMLDPVHPAEVDDHLSVVYRARVAVAPVLAGADRIERRLAAARDFHELARPRPACPASEQPPDAGWTTRCCGRSRSRVASSTSTLTSPSSARHPESAPGRSLRGSRALTMGIRVVVGHVAFRAWRWRRNPAGPPSLAIRQAQIPFISCSISASCWRLACRPA